MDINEIKKMIKGKNDRIIIVDELGKPLFIVSAYNQDQENAQNKAIPSEEICENVEYRNTEVDDCQGRLTIEDLPYL